MPSSQVRTLLSRSLFLFLSTPLQTRISLSFYSSWLFSLFLPLSFSFSLAHSLYPSFSLSLTCSLSLSTCLFSLFLYFCLSFFLPLSLFSSLASRQPLFDKYLRIAKSVSIPPARDARRSGKIKQLTMNFYVKASIPHRKKISTRHYTDFMGELRVSN